MHETLPTRTTAEGTEEAFEAMLCPIVAGTAGVIGEDFFRSLVQQLGLALDVRYAFVAELSTRPGYVRTLAYWSRDGFRDNVEYALTGSPCEAVLAGNMRYYPEGVCELFPLDLGLVKLGTQSFLAIPLCDGAERVMGHLAVFDDKPMHIKPSGMAIFHIFGARVAAELERRRTEQALQRSEARLATILSTAMDAIVTIDADRHITLFNAAAEQMFGCSAAWAISQPFDRFLSKPFRALLAEYLAARKDHAGGKSMWVPEGLTAVTLDGKTFPIEVTVSPSEIDGDMLFTLILRDINERKKAEQQLGHLRVEMQYLREEIHQEYNLDEMVSISPVMQALFSHLQKVAPTDSTVLVTGETGVGKEMIARALHNLSARRDKPLIKLNCAALPSELIESELFGHEKGAFTGATVQRIGRFELAHGGTLFLDEVGELTAPAQAKLLRALQEQEFERVGGNRTIHVDVRLIAATNRNLADMVQAGSFRNDLFYRLYVFPVQVPALRERTADIPLLSRRFLAKYTRKLGKSLRDFTPAALERMARYAWPGNVRELQNVVERAAILCDGPLVEIGNEALPSALLAPSTTATGEALENTERQAIVAALKNTRWVIEGPNGAAQQLRLNASTLRSRMKKLGIHKPDSQG